MGAFKVDCELQELTRKQPPVNIAGVMVDTGSEYTWLPEKLLAQAGVEGFAALVDARRKRLVASGPLPVAVGTPSNDHSRHRR
jgi:hypothetical protein